MLNYTCKVLNSLKLTRFESNGDKKKKSSDRVRRLIYKKPKKILLKSALLHLNRWSNTFVNFTTTSDETYNILAFQII